MTLWQRVVRANQPGPAEHSVPFRIASTLAVVVSIGACWSQHELRPTVAALTMVATVVGNYLSYRRRERPWVGIKPILAVCVIGGFVWFILTVSTNATPGDIASVEAPLAALFAWVLSTHAFDVPARRDVAYSLAGSAALMAVAAAQTVDLSVAGFVVAWVACGMWGLVSMWKSMAGARGLPWLSLTISALVVAVLTVALVGLLPAPRVSTSLIFPSSSAGDSPVNSPTRLSDGAANLPAHAAPPDGPNGVGGYLGFARSLDTANRVALGNQVVMRVRASRPSFWVGETYDQWNGQSWEQSHDPANGKGVAHLTSGSPFAIPLATDQLAERAVGSTDIQTFYLAESGPNLVFHADNAQRVYLQSKQLFLTGDGTIVSSTSMGSGTVYTVVSNDITATPTQLRGSSGAGPPGQLQQSLSPAERNRYLQLPRSDARVTALATSITAGIGTPQNPDPYDKVAAIESWMSSHIHYSTSIPPLRPGQDAVDSFLFGSRIGYCEQISTATAVMLRSLGIPAREAVGYVPGSYNPITDLYDVQAKDAHAWVQVWFPGYGWQDFDPTADVPLANPTPGSIIVRSTDRVLRHLPWVPIGLVFLALAGVATLQRRRKHRPPTWAHRVAADLARAGSQAGIHRRPDETLVSYCRRLAESSPADAEQLEEAGSLVERYAYAGEEPSADRIARVTAFAKQFRAVKPSQPRVIASASPNDAPAASRGR